jgi:hypothetical protein
MSSEKQSVFFGTFGSYVIRKLTLDEVPRLESLPVFESPEVEATPLAGSLEINLVSSSWDKVFDWGSDVSVQTDDPP